MNLSDALNRAVQHQQSGRLAEAEQIYAQILSAHPDQPFALNLLGILHHQCGRSDQALAMIHKAIEIVPSEASFHSNLGKVLRDTGNWPRAIAGYQTAMRLDPKQPVNHNNLGELLRETGDLDAAEAACRTAIQLAPNYVEAHCNLGLTLAAQGKLDDAASTLRRAIELNPAFAPAFNNLGLCLGMRGQYDEGIAALRKAVELSPDYFEGFNNLGVLLRARGDLESAAEAYERAIALKPQDPKAHNSLSNVLRDRGELDRALWAAQQALALQPDYADAHNNLGNVLKDEGLLEDALVHFRRAVALKPDSAALHSNLLYTLYFDPCSDAKAIYDEHCRWNQQHGAGLRNSNPPQDNDADRSRRLRIGFVSPNLRDHVVGWFLLPLLERHDREQFEFICYADVAQADPTTATLQSQVAVWRNTAGLRDQRLADLIREDRIDILIDLTLHMANNRMGVFARKPAPVQATYLAYPGTSGLDAMDYRITDARLDPPGAQEFYSERSVRLESYWCYHAHDVAPAPNALPSLRTGRVTFGCFNNFGKVTDVALGSWVRILAEVPQSRLILHAHPGGHRTRVLEHFARAGVDPRRIEFVGHQRLPEYFAQHHRIDIALDPTPYAGGTTTCDALWMGVPMITLAGGTAVSRAGASLSTTVGLPELIATREDEYVKIAIDLASDLPRLSNLRETLRERMRYSALMDATRFARNFEAALRTMWNSWCDR